MLGCIECGGGCGKGLALSGMGGLGDDSSSISFPWDVSSDPLPVLTSDPITPWGTSAGGGSVGSGINWNSILGMWTQAGTQIAKASAGALPSFQQVTPYGSTTIFGSSSGNMAIPGLPSSIGGIGLGTLAIGGIALVVIMKMFGSK